MQPILIQGPMDCETDLLFQRIENPIIKIIDGFVFASGTISGVPVVVSRTHIGMVNAAIAGKIGIDEYAPRAVISQGTAGGHSPRVHAGDIIIGARMVNIDSYQTATLDAGEGLKPNAYVPFEVEVSDGKDWKNEIYLFSDKRLVSAASKSPYAKGQVVTGTIGTGSSWNSEKDKIRVMFQKLGTDCEEMENFAVAQLCSIYDIPHLAIRVISNNVYTGEEFDPETARSCQEFVINALPRIAQAL